MLQYKVIQNITQYRQYTDALERLVFSKTRNRDAKDKIALLTLLIEKWDRDHNTFNGLDPVQLLRSLMNEHDIKANGLVNILGISKGYVSDILNYKKGLSKGVIRKLATYFKVSQEAFNRPYNLIVPTLRQRTSKGLLPSTR